MSHLPPKDRHRDPEEFLNVNEQLMYKLASLTASVDAGFRRLDEKMDRFQTDLHNSQLSSNDRINALDKEMSERFAMKRTRMDGHEKRLITIETWQEVAMAKVGIIVAVASLALTLLAPTVRSILGIAS